MEDGSVSRTEMCGGGKCVEDESVEDKSVEDGTFSVTEHGLEILIWHSLKSDGIGNTFTTL